MPNVALFIFGVNDLSGGGGAERFFADFFDIYNSNKTKHHLFYIIDENSRVNLRKVNKLTSSKNLLNFNIVSNRFKRTMEFLQLLRLIVFKQIKLIHIPLYSISYVPIINSLNKLPNFLRPKIVVNIVNCEIPHAYFDPSNPFSNGYQKTYDPLFHTYIDGYFCWNKLFIDFVMENKLIKVGNPKFKFISSRFSDTNLFTSQLPKKNIIVFASRLDFRKRPDWFIKAIKVIHDRNTEIFKEYEFKMYGKGPMLEELQVLIKNLGIDGFVKVETNPKLWEVLNTSRVFVSCQDYDNFPSLAIAEAMASGNAIIARNVGQTNLFVEHLKNGLILKEDSYHGLADAIEYYIEHPETHDSFSNESLRLIKEVHNPENFIRQIDEFWNTVMKN